VGGLCAWGVLSGRGGSACAVFCQYLQVLFSRKQLSTGERRRQVLIEKRRVFKCREGVGFCH